MAFTETKINGVDYLIIPKADYKEKSESTTLDGKPFVIVRTQSAGVFAGYLYSRNGQEVKLLKARRIWYWTGAASLSQLAEEGTSSPSTCKFPCEVEAVELMQAIEVLSVTAKAEKSIKGVAIWKQ